MSFDETQAKRGLFIYCGLRSLKLYHYDQKERLGNIGDGGYVIGIQKGGYDCYISAGVANEESFSSEFIKRYGMNKSNSFAYDGTIKQYPYQFTKDITFVKKNIGRINNKTTTNLSDLINKYNNIFLKMDIEGAEYGWLIDLTDEQLKKFKQIVIEFHELGSSTSNDRQAKEECFDKLNRTHQAIHAHANNVGGMFYYVPDILELTYIRKENELKPNKTPFPIKIDHPNTITKPQITLDYPPFIEV